MFSRFHDDSARIEKQLEISSFQGRYALNTPGNGVNLPFQEDPQLRIQKWGANLHTNAINLESDLHGLTRKLNRDYVDSNDYTQYSAHSTSYSYDSVPAIIDESRATHPAWMYRTFDATRWETPFLNPLVNIEKGFHDNIQTRILEKDFYKPTKLRNF
jgi:hypothetical protein